MSYLSHDELVQVAISILRSINADIEEADLDMVQWLGNSRAKYSLAIMVKFMQVTKRNAVWQASKTARPVYSDDIPNIKETLPNRKLFIQEKLPEPTVQVMPATSTTTKRSAQRLALRSAHRSAQGSANRSVIRLASKEATKNTIQRLKCKSAKTSAHLD